MTCREKGGSQTALSENTGYWAVTYRQNPFLRKRFSHLSGTQMGILKFVLSYFVLILSCKSFGMRVDSMGFVFQALDVSTTFSESIEMIVDGNEWKACLFIGLLRSFLALQDRADQLIFLCWVHSFAAIICLLW